MSGGEGVPDFATHYYRASRAPFLSLSDLPGEQAVAVMAELIRLAREVCPVPARSAERHQSPARPWLMTPTPVLPARPRRGGVSRSVRFGAARRRGRS